MKREHLLSSDTAALFSFDGAGKIGSCRFSDQTGSVPRDVLSRKELVAMRECLLHYFPLTLDEAEGAISEAVSNRLKE